MSQQTVTSGKLSVDKAQIKKLTRKGKKILVKIKALKGVTGYQVAYATKKSMKNAKKLLSKKTSVTLKKLSTKKYYVRVRAYKMVSGKTYYGKWSKILKK